jgi:hypothetical protein
VNDRTHKPNAPTRDRGRDDDATSFGPIDIVLRVAIVALALGTTYIHLTLGGLLFTLNAAGYLVGAVAMVAPIAIARRYRWLIRIGLATYAMTTIAAWVVDGPHFSLAYLAKAIELALITLLAVEFARDDGIGRARRLFQSGSAGSPT